MSDTPRTDALAEKLLTRTMDEGILLDHARQLERENAALRQNAEEHRQDVIAREEEIKKLHRSIEQLKDQFSDAMQLDLEHGVAWMNEEAGRKFVKEYPLIHTAIVKLMELNNDVNEA